MPHHLVVTTEGHNRATVRIHADRKLSGGCALKNKSTRHCCDPPQQQHQHPTRQYAMSHTSSTATPPNQRPARTHPFGRIYRFRPSLHHAINEGPISSGSLARSRLDQVFVGGTKHRGRSHGRYPVGTPPERPISWSWRPVGYLRGKEKSTGRIQLLYLNCGCFFFETAEGASG